MDKRTLELDFLAFEDVEIPTGERTLPYCQLLGNPTVVKRTIFLTGKDNQGEINLVFSEEIIKEFVKFPSTFKITIEPI